MTSPAASIGRRHMFIPDTQIKPGVNTDHIEAAANCAVDMLPDVIVLAGDWFDMPSLSSWDKKKKSFEGRKYVEDIKSGTEALERFCAPISKEMARRKRGKRKAWNPELHVTLGNHEQRIERAVEEARELECLMSYDDFDFEKHGFTVHDYLVPVIIDGVAYSHFYTSGPMNRPIGNARLMLQRLHMSALCGHTQPRDIAFVQRIDGTRMTAIMGGIFYTHDEGYLSAQQNTDRTWSGIWVLNQVRDGSFDELPLSIDYLMRKYG